MTHPAISSLRMNSKHWTAQLSAYDRSAFGVSYRHLSMTLTRATVTRSIRDENSPTKVLYQHRGSRVVLRWQANTEDGDGGPSDFYACTVESAEVTADAARLIGKVAKLGPASTVSPRAVLEALNAIEVEYSHDTGDHLPCKPSKDIYSPAEMARLGSAAA